MGQGHRRGPNSDTQNEIQVADDEPTIHSFIVKIWINSSHVEGSAWTGYITHVPSNVRRSLRTLDEIVAFIAPFLIGSEQ